MTSLRSLLEQHADSVPADVPATRIAAVHRRIAVARRRRTAGAVALVVAVLVVGAVGIALPRSERPSPAGAPATMVGHAVPMSTGSLGATYTYVRGYVGRHGVLTVTLPSATTPLLVRAASQAATGRVQIGSGDAAWVTPAGAFGAFTTVDPGADRQLHVTLHGGTGPVALAVYRQTAPPPGFHRDGVTYPSVVDGHRLLGAVLSSGGVGAATLHLHDAPAIIRLAPYCSGGAAGTRVRVSDAAGFIEEGGCDDRAPLDVPHNGSAAVARRDGSTYRVQAIDRSGRPVTGAVRVGLGIYAATATELHNGIAPQVDEAGHRWQLVRVQRSTPGVDGIGRAVNSEEPVLVRWGGGGGPALVQLRIDGRVRDQGTGGGIGSAVLSTVSGHDQVAVHATGSPRRPLVLAVYRLAD